MPRFAPYTETVPLSGIRRVHEVALRMQDVVHLAVGEPDVAVAPHVLTAGAEAWLADDTDYTPNGGIAELRQALADKLARDNGIDVTADRVWVTQGATEGLFLAMSLTLGAGDEVLIPDPGYTTFTMGARIVGAVPVPYPLRPEQGFTPLIADLERQVSPRTRAIVVNSPSNPLGAVFDRDVLAALLAFAERHDLWLISDEVYEAFTYGTPHVSPASLPGGAERVLSVFSLSKTYALTGARIGYLVMPPGQDDLMRSFQEAIISCVDTPAQRAALAAVTGPQDAVLAAKAHYRENLLAVRELLDARGIRYLDPRGAFYLWIDASAASGGDVAAWALTLLAERRVSVAPGSAFGASGEGWIRVCLAASRDSLVTGLTRIAKELAAAVVPA